MMIEFCDFIRLRNRQMSFLPHKQHFNWKGDESKMNHSKQKQELFPFDYVFGIQFPYKVKMKEKLKKILICSMTISTK